MQQQIFETFKAQGDYLTFAVVTLIVIAVVKFGIRRFRPTVSFPWQLWMLVLVVLSFGWGATQRAGEHAREENIAMVSAMAPTYAAEMERRGHSRITESTPPDDPVYLELIRAQIQWEKLNPFAHDIYTFRKRADGTNILVVDSETDYDKNGDFNGKAESRTPIGKVYLQAVKGLEKAYLGEANFDPEIYDDEWGAWVSAFVPMHDADGKVEAVLGVDFAANSWVAAIAQARRGAIWVTAFLLAIILGGGTAIALLRADLVQRTIAEQRLRESEQRLLLTIRQMPLGFIEWDVEANVRIWNPAAERIFGYSAAEVNGRKAFPLIVASSALQHVDELWSKLLRNVGGTHSINENITKDGRTILCEWFNTPLFGPDNKVVAIFSLFQDITDRVNLEKQLQRSERLGAIGQLSAGVAHDFNNILTIITGNVGMLLAPDQPAGSVRTGLKSIEDAALRAAGLTRQLLAFSRQQAMFPRVLHLGESVKGTAPMLSRALTTAVNFKVNVAGHVPPIEADPAMLEQIITNLVLNARDALPDGGDITVSVQAVHVSEDDAGQNASARPGPAVRLSIADNGTGIPAEHLPRIFEPFFTTKLAGRGTGLGLSVVHGIVQQHRGWITVDSTPGKGSTFHVFFPPSDRKVADAPSENPPAVTARVASKSGHTILLVEDEAAVGDLARLILESAGYRVLLASDGHEALKLWGNHRHQIDLLLTDMVMPNGLTGHKLSLQLLKEQPDLPVIYASGYSIEFAALDFSESDRTVFLPKPYLADELVATVRRCLHQAG
ncbi:MAG: ATP-binding protein [Verrucomicrobiales bacterium]|nr:ATP-binding protein [Verrucomicrobiales bacterium]